jgi:hypothetical protein
LIAVDARAKEYGEFVAQVRARMPAAVVEVAAEGAGPGRVAFAEPVWQNGGKQ